MKIGKTLKTKLARCLYDRNQPQLFYMKRSLTIAYCYFGISLIILFVPFEANNVTEYVTSAFVSVASIGIVTSFIDTSIKSAKVFSLIDLIEKIVNSSKYFELFCFFSICTSIQKLSEISQLNTGLKCSPLKAMYINTNESTEKYCKILNFIFDLAPPGVNLPTAIYSFYMYYTTDLGGDAFKLSLPLW